MVTEGLLDKFLARSNFIRAYERVVCKNSRGGIDKISIEEFNRRFLQNLNKIQEAVRTGRYVPSPSELISVPKYNKPGEFRDLGLPTVADKIVQAALLQVVEPLGEKIFSDRSYGYRRGKGLKKAIRRVDHILNNLKKPWVITGDIDNFFDSLNYDLLISRFSDLVGGEVILVKLVALWCRMGLVDRNRCWRDVRSGIRQGHVIAPFLANLYLNSLDQFLTSLDVEWVRYADNFMVACEAEEKAESNLGRIEQFLKEELFLRLNDRDKKPRHIESGFNFLGICFHGNDRTIDSDKFNGMEARIRSFLSEKNRLGPEETVLKLKEMLDGWKRHYSHIKPNQQFLQLDELIKAEFSHLVRLKVESKQWQPGFLRCLSLPALISDDGDRKVAMRTEQVREKTGQSKEGGGLSDLKHSADLKVAVQRRKFYRENASKGNIFVVEPGYFVGKKGQMIVVRDKRRTIDARPVGELRGLTISNKGVAVSGDAVELCLKNNCFIHFVDDKGRITAVVICPDGDAAEISLLQVRERENERGLELAREFVLGKVKNQFALLKYYHKYPVNQKNGFGRIMSETREKMEHLIDEISSFKPDIGGEAYRVRLMGMEGAFGACYWHAIKHLFSNRVLFNGRERQGARDLVNAALNYGYGILYGRIFNALVRAGLNPAAGFLHSLRENKLSLVYDLIEEFRSVIVDRSIIGMLNRGEKLVQGEDGLFVPDTKQRIAASVFKHLASEVSYCGRRMILEEVIRGQALRIRKHLLGISRYRPFLWRW